jgi:hypothetical protein
MFDDGNIGIDAISFPSASLGAFVLWVHILKQLRQNILKYHLKPVKDSIGAIFLVRLGYILWDAFMNTVIPVMILTFVNYFWSVNKFYYRSVNIRTTTKAISSNRDEFVTNR